ncbi:alpha-glucuronidase [Gaoshiqia sediminis]|uniref:Alpha-glucuronidase n=1 Tax=Gaoshiqia sediminis TaxID=2986998 RepID=A0AA41Y795_9BACT|nr:alpha-glucuronidase [Gaoshiqia sediminis]MCW0483264.1 alpha-glucuronidase [Gaoshiqia sediminis]
MRVSVCVFILLLIASGLKAEDGSGLWLRNNFASPVNVVGSHKSTIFNVAKQELLNNWQGKENATINLLVKKDKRIIGDGFLLSSDKIQANTDLGILYGVFELLRQQQTHQTVSEKVYNPSYELRLLNHWDNLNSSVERGYAGKSIFWRTGENGLVVTENDKRIWTEYARANASIGINGAAINNVNASPDILRPDRLERVKAIADILRTYGLKLYISINFSSPKIVGGLSDSDPLNPEVINWWKEKVKEIYTLIPDFGGFLVKANSEGQPGPQDYGRTHVDGANMLADAVKPYGGIIMWRAFVYSSEEDDRAKQAYAEFVPFDGQFRENVIVQVKNGPIDFQPREPFNPLFGAMKKTAIMPELQITQEYFGHSTHLVYLAPMWEEFFHSDTHQEGTGSTVARCTDGSIFKHRTAIAGVANTGTDTNWCGHHFAQANWYAYGRMAWNNQLTSDQIADEWIKLTFNPETNVRVALPEDWSVNFLKPIKQVMLESYEASVNYMMPLGFHHIFQASHHYGPGPWWERDGVRKDWTMPYYHNADTIGVGFNRTITGSNAVAQYHEPLKSIYGNLETCPEEFLLWFHHVPWNHKMKNGNTLWDEICYRYDSGVKQVRQFQVVWDKAQPYVDAGRFDAVQRRLRTHAHDAQIWKDACLLYFQEFSRKPIPFDIERPIHNLDEIKKNDMDRP